MKRFQLAGLSFALAIIVGCGESFGPDVRVATLRLQPTVLDVAADGGRAALLIYGVATDGRQLLPAPRVMLFVRDTAIATMESSGAAFGSDLVIGRHPGTTYIVGVATDSPDTARDSVLVRVGRFSASQARTDQP